MTDLTRFTCEDTFRRLDDYLDRELSAEEMRLVGQHLDTCAHCMSEFTFEASVINTVRAKLQRIAVPPDLLAKISARLGKEGR